MQKFRELPIFQYNARWLIKKRKASSINQSTIKLVHECYYRVMLAMDIYFLATKAYILHEITYVVGASKNACNGKQTHFGIIAFIN